jgi:hypothetical protein
MVPTEEERLPVRVSIPVRGLSAVDFLHSCTLRRSPLFASLCLIRSSHTCISMVMLHAGLKPERTLLVLSQTILLIEFPYYVRHLSLYVLRSILAGRECCAARLHDNQ